jgi:MFS family permease
MTTQRRSIATLLLGTGFLFLGNGLLVTLLPLRSQMEGFSLTVIGALGTVFFGGFVLGCLFGPRIVKSVGHIRCFAGFAALVAAGILLYPLWLGPVAWLVIRGATGFCYAILFMVIESWLNEQSSNQVRGAVLSLYIIVTNIVTIGGQLMVNLSAPQDAALFSLAAILACLSLVPLSLTSTASPKPIPRATLRIRYLFRLSPSAFIGCFAVGLVEGAFWSFGPVFGQLKGLSIAEVTGFMAAFMVGGTLSQWPIGRLSDRVDRRLMITACAFGSLATGLTLAIAPLSSPFAMLAVAVAHGAVMLPIYALCIAHANDYAPSEDLVETSGGLLLVYAGGAMLGPMIVGPLMEAFGPGQLFFFIALLLGALDPYFLYRSRPRPVVDEEERVEFVPLLRTTPSLYTLEEDDPEGGYDLGGETGRDH